MLAIVRRLWHGFRRQGYGHKKAGVGLMDLASPDQLQADLVGPARAGDDKLMVTLDAINRRFGRNVADLGASGWQGTAQWHSRQESLSGRSRHHLVTSLARGAEIELRIDG